MFSKLVVLLDGRLLGGRFWDLLTSSLVLEDG